MKWSFKKKFSFVSLFGTVVLAAVSLLVRQDTVLKIEKSPKVQHQRITQNPDNTEAVIQEIIEVRDKIAKYTTIFKHFRQDGKRGHHE
ncbi:hypothetical protein P0136_10745 [Lentisphaerota bacterium ZTH]|nr:hypothetical protein JYG24_11735 [Lentisphaerota bacterium]WET05839.1 hypothetical protein P0136_10745 [Lentisphaerota bacterium ZTH]